MKLKISEEQFDLINKEITILEDKLTLMYEEKNRWGVYFISEKIELLKEIIRTEEIEITN